MITLFKKLTSIYGIGKNRAKLISIQIGIPLNTNINQIPPKKQDELVELLNYYMKLENNDAIGKSLIRYRKNRISRLINLNSFKGKKHQLGLPVNGQRTRSNGKTGKKLNKKIML